MSESSARNPQSFYAMTKAQAMWVGEKFRNDLGLHVSSGILFNHESHLRRPSFLSAKIIQGAIDVKMGRVAKIFVRDLDSSTDWGHARDFVEAFQQLLKADSPGDYVIATGENHTVREFISVAFAALGLDWTKHVQEDSSLVGRARISLQANPSKIFAATTWRPENSFDGFVRSLVADHLRFVEKPKAKA
jgi:GDPmannose 4,6-dehydratase